MYKQEAMKQHRVTGKQQKQFTVQPTNRKALCLEQRQAQWSRRSIPVLCHVQRERGSEGKLGCTRESEM